MKQLLFTLIALFAFSFSYAQAAELDPSFDAVKSLLLPAITGGIIALLHDARKHLFKADWDWMLFLKTNVLPFLATAVLAAGIYLLIAYVPFLTPILEIAAESSLTEISTVTIFAAATKIVKMIFKGIFKTDIVVVEPVITPKV